MNELIFTGVANAHCITYTKFISCCIYLQYSHVCFVFTDVIEAKVILSYNIYCL